MTSADCSTSAPDDTAGKYRASHGFPLVLLGPSCLGLDLVPVTLRWEVQNCPSLYDLVLLIKRMLRIYEMGMNDNRQTET